MNRFDLEDAMSSLYNIGDDIDTVLHSYMDARVRPSEDDMANMLIGVKTLYNARYQKMWEIFEELIKTGVIKDCNKLSDCEVIKRGSVVQSSPELEERFQK